MRNIFINPVKSVRC